MPKAFVGVTDGDWYDLLRGLSDLDEVNFWQPSPAGSFRALQPGELFLFKLHSPQDVIVGGGLFAHRTVLPVSMAWESFGPKNGASTQAEMLMRIQKYRKPVPGSPNDPMIGCILLEQPFFLDQDLWFPAPEWKANIVRGRGYDLTVEPGLTLLRELQMRATATSQAVGAAEAAPRYGDALVRVRLGQGSFRVLVTDAYQRRCAVTGERVLPVLEAAHIRPYAAGGEHRVDNGLLLRSDLHTLFDRGYVTVTPELRVEVSNRLRSDFDNGEEYRRWHGNEIAVPADASMRPSHEFLEWHNQSRYVA